MARPTRPDWLDQVIVEAKPGQTPRADFDAWRRTQAAAIRLLKQRGAQIPRRRRRLLTIIQLGTRAVRSLAAGFAVAAAVIVVICVLVSPRNRSAPAPPARMAATPEVAPPAKPSESEIAASELNVAQELFDQRDAGGLLSLLGTARPQTAVAIATYLGQIGDLSSVPTLNAFAARWQGPAQDNPFRKAATEIRDRHKQSQSNPVAFQEPHPPATPASVIEPSAPKEDHVQTYRGVVLDPTGHPVEKARVWAQSCAKDLKLTNLVAPIVTDSRGRFQVRVPAGDRDAAESVYLLCKHPAYALGWMRLPTDQSAADLGDCVILLCEPTVVAGTVRDPQSHAIAGALVEARVMVEHNAYGAQEYPYTADNDRAAKTDAGGRFVLEDVPVGSVLNLFVSRQGYGSYDSREGEGRYAFWPGFIDPEAYTVQAGQRNLLIELASATGQIDGRVVSDNGSLYDKDATILCERTDDPTIAISYGYSQGKWILRNRRPQGRCSTVTGGRFRIEDLAVGSYLVTAMDPRSGDLLTMPLQVIVSGRSSRNPVTLKVCRTSRITVHLFDAKTNEPLTDALVVANCGLRTHRYTDASGQCVFQLVPGDYTLSTCGWGHGTMPIHVASSPKEQRIRMPVVVPPALPGRLVDEIGMPVRGTVYVDAGQQIATDAEGRFLVPGPARGGVGLARDLAGTRGRLFWETMTDSQAELEVRLEPVAVFTGRILDWYGNPISSSVAFAFFTPGVSTGSYYPLGHLSHKLSPPNGQFQIKVPIGLPLLFKVAFSTSTGQSELVSPLPGKTYDLGNIVLPPPSSLKPRMGLSQK